MAAARRSSESAVVVWMVVFLVLAVVAICATVAFYQRSNKAREAILTEQGAFEKSIAAVFKDNGWTLTEQSPPELGMKYGGTSYAEVRDKLQQAAEYEKQVKPLTGWDSLAGLQAALDDSPAQKEAATKGQSKLSNLKSLLSFYETSNTQQADSITSLRTQAAGLTGERDKLQATLADREKVLGQQVADAQKALADQTAKMKKDYDDMVASFDAMRLKQSDTQDKLQQETDTHKNDVTKLQDQVATLQAEVRRLTVPGEGKQLTAEGKIVSIQAEFDMVYINIGKDKNLKENDTFVVYGQTPDGRDRYKGTVKVTQVYDTTGRASIVDEKEFILQGDSLATTQQWDLFHPKPAAAAPAAAAKPAAPAATPAAPAASVAPAVPAASAAPAAPKPAAPAPTAG